MIFNTSIEQKRIQAVNRLSFLINKEAKVEIIEKSPNRTIPQNNYLHLLFGWFALETGYEREYVKQIIFKQLVNSDVFKYTFITKDGEEIEYWKSTKNIPKDVMTVCIEKFRNYSAIKINLYLPEPNDLALLEQIENQLEEYKNKIYL